MHRWKVLPNAIKDTRVVATMLDPHKEKFWNPTRRAFDHGLAALVFTEYGVTLDKSIAVSDWFHELSPQQIEYAAKDVYFLPKLLTDLTSRLTAEQRAVAEKVSEWIPAKVYLDLRNLADPSGRV
jgi:ribonuclease D